MKDVLRRGDPAFYDKEPFVLRTLAQVPRYSEDAQVEARLDVLGSDPVLHATTFLIALSTCAAAIAIDPLASPFDWVRAGAFVALALAGPFALPWQRHALKRECLAIAALGAAALFAESLIAAPIVAVAAVVASALAGGAIARTCRVHPQTYTWCAFSIVLATCAYAFAFSGPGAASRLSIGMTAVAVAYLGAAVFALRIRRAELMARPEGVVSLPQSVVPLLDRSHHHAVICWLG